MAGHFGAELRKARMEAGLTLSVVARHMGWSVSYISGVELGVQAPPAEEKVLELCRLLGVYEPSRLLALAVKNRKGLIMPHIEDDEAAQLLAALRSGVTPQMVGKDVRALFRKLSEEEK